MSEKTALERQEDELKQGTIFGKPSGLGAGDKSMLEMSPTNRLIISAEQSALQLAINLLHRALYERDNIDPPTRRVYDEAAEKWRTETVRVDNWRWLADLDRAVRENQLVMRGYSRSQHLRQSAEMQGLAIENEQPGLLQRLFGR